MRAAKIYEYKRSPWSGSSEVSVGGIPVLVKERLEASEAESVLAGVTLLELTDSRTDDRIQITDNAYIVYSRDQFEISELKHIKYYFYTECGGIPAAVGVVSRSSRPKSHDDRGRKVPYSMFAVRALAFSILLTGALLAARRRGIPESAENKTDDYSMDNKILADSESLGTEDGSESLGDYGSPDADVGKKDSASAEADGGRRTDEEEADLEVKKDKKKKQEKAEGITDSTEQQDSFNWEVYKSELQNDNDRRGGVFTSSKNVSTVPEYAPVFASFSDILVSKESPDFIFSNRGNRCYDMRFVIYCNGIKLWDSGRLEFGGQAVVRLHGLLDTGATDIKIKQISYVNVDNSRNVDHRFTSYNKMSFTSRVTVYNEAD